MLAADPVISEFQASNVSTITDEDGNTSDWIEIQNPDAQAVSLDGWYLTDDAADLTKWQFPAVNLAAGEELLVFASGKDRAIAGAELHANFRLSVDGEFLALVRPDGTTVVQSYDPYPAQFDNQSYGLAIGRDVTEFVTSPSVSRVLVPTNDALGNRWTQPAFDDSTWQSGSLPVGYETLQTGVTQREDFDAPLGTNWKLDLPPAGTSTVQVTGGKLSMIVPTGQDIGYADRGEAPYVYSELPGDAPADWEVITEVNQGSGDRGAAGIAVIDGDTGTAAIQLEYNGRLSFRLQAADKRIGTKVSLSRQHYFLRLVRDGQAGSWSGYYKVNEADDWRLIATTSDIEGAPQIDNPLPALYARTPSSTMNVQFEFAEVIIPDQRPVYGTLINTDLRASLLNQNSSVYLRLPFDVTGDASRFDEMTFQTRFDDGFQAYLNGTPVASHNVPVDATWDSAAAGVFGAVAGRIPSRQFTLDGFTDLLQAGTNVLAIHGMNVTSDDTDFFFDGQLTGAEILSQTAQFFATPTPNAQNERAATPPPKIMEGDGIFFGATTVQINVDDPNPQFEIRYTLDGSEPMADSILYTKPLELTESAMLQARVFDASPSNALDPGPVVGATFVALSDTLKDRSSDIPLVILDTLGQGIPSSGSTSLASVNVIAMEVSKATGRSSFSNGIVDYVGRGGIRDRGSSTAGQPKPNLAFETWGSTGTTDDDDEDVALLGFGAESDWVLHAPYSFDPAMIRNQLAYGMANAIGRWAPGTRPIEVYINRRNGTVGEEDYAGIYVLTERIKRGKDRVDIVDIGQNDNQEPEITGGFIWKIDRADPQEPGFSAGGVTLNWVEPKSPLSRTASDDQKATIEQQNWVIDYFNQFRDAARTTGIDDPNGYSKFIDIGSWIDHHLISVLGDNVDALNLSTYLFKDRGKKIEFGPQWDFDRSMESRDGRDDDPLKWGGSGGTAFFTSNLWSVLFRDPGFWQAYVDRWTELRRGPLSDASLNAMIDDDAAEIEEAQVRNIAKWSASRGRRSSAYNSGKLDGTWQGEVEHLRSWLLARAQFMDSNFSQPPTLMIDDQVVPVGGMLADRGVSVSIEGPQQFFFDDTEFIPSELGAATARYFSPTDDSLGTDWVQPAFDDGGWASGPLGLGFDTGTDYEALIQTEAMPAEGGTTILLRVPFQIDSLNDIDNLVLRMRYDDGFVAYLNGIEITNRNMRDLPLAWNSRAKSHRDSEGVVFEDIDVSEFRNLLVEGENVLAIRLINSSTTSSDIFVQPALVKRRVEFGISPVGDVYYTTDGTDPRGSDGNPTAAAQLAPRGQQLVVNENTRIIARTFDDVSDRGRESRIVRTDWSAPVEYNFVTQTPELVITELNYNPAKVTDAEAAAGFVNEDFEFIEIRNLSSSAADLTGVELTDGVEFSFFGSSITSLDRNQSALVVANQQAFEQRYGSNLPVAGEFSGSLSNSGERIKLIDGVGNELFSINYSDNDLWGVAADGVGATLELIDPQSISAAARSKWYSWNRSSVPGGSPGATQTASPGIVINEILARTATPVTLTDSIELLNTTSQPIDIGGWTLSDDAQKLDKFRIPAGTILGPGEYVVFDEGQFNADTPAPGATPFALNGEQGESVWLVELDPQGNVSRFIDEIVFRSTFNGESIGRLPDGDGRLGPLTRTTLGSANESPRVGPLVISEVQYNPTVSDAALAQDPTLETSDLEFIEIHNPTAAGVDLANWRLRGGVDYNFNDGVTLDAGASLVVLKFNPDDPENINQVNAFRAQYQIDEQTTLVGGYGGLLGNGGDRVTLLRPEVVDADSQELIYISEDDVLFDDLLPWPTGADGNGGSLQRRSASGYGNDAASWFSGPATPGQIPSVLPGDFDGDGLVSAADIDLINERLQIADNDLAFDLDGDGQLSVADRDVLIFSVLGTTYGDSNLDGIFNSADLVSVFAQGQYEDATPGNSTWSDGDWDGDGDFQTADIVFVFSFGGYSVASTDASRPLTATPRAASQLQQQAAAVDAVWDNAFQDLWTNDREKRRR